MLNMDMSILILTNLSINQVSMSSKSFILKQA